MIQRFVSGVLSTLLLAVVASAQTLTVPAGPLTSGSSAKIIYNNPGKANTTITLVIDDGGVPSPTRIEIQIPLDGSGEGSVNWTVLPWWIANFNAPSVKEVVRSIV